MKVSLENDVIRFDDVFFGMDEGVAYNLFVSNVKEGKFRIVIRANGGGYYNFLDESKHVHKDDWVSCAVIKENLRQLIKEGWTLEAFDHSIDLFKRITNWWANQTAIQEDEDES